MIQRIQLRQLVDTTAVKHGSLEKALGRLENKVAVITGAASGIGLGTVELFISEGAQIVAADIQDDKGQKLERQFKGRLKYIHCDVTEEEEMKAAIHTAADSFGGLDILFNNAGSGGAPNTIEDMTFEAWDRTMRLLLTSVVMGMRFAAPLMKKRGQGSIINTASVAAVQAGMGSIAYSTAKAAIIHLTTIAAAQLGRANIRVNAISPGFIRSDIYVTSMLATGMEKQLATNVAAGMFDQQSEYQPIPKAGMPDDVAKACLYFASEDSLFVTGTNLIVDGGLVVGPRHSWDVEEQQRRLQSRLASARIAP